MGGGGLLMAPLRATCRSCGQEVTFYRHSTTGRSAPLQPDPVGRWAVVGDAYFAATANLAPAHRFSSHFATCPSASAHRRPPA